MTKFDPIDRMRDSVESLRRTAQSKRQIILAESAALDDLESQIEKLESAIRIIDEFIISGMHDGNDLAGQTVLECSFTILKACIPEPRHYRELATESIARGYRSPKGNDDFETIARTFWDTLRKAKDRDQIPLQFVGEGRFKYAPEAMYEAPRDDRRTSKGYGPQTDDYGPDAPDIPTSGAGDGDIPF